MMICLEIGLCMKVIINILISLGVGLVGQIWITCFLAMHINVYCLQSNGNVEYNYKIELICFLLWFHPFPEVEIGGICIDMRLIDVEVGKIVFLFPFLMWSYKRTIWFLVLLPSDF